MATSSTGSSTTASGRSRTTEPAAGGRTGESSISTRRSSAGSTRPDAGSRCARCRTTRRSSMPSGPEVAAARFDEPDVLELAVAQQEEMRALYDGEADIGPTRDAWMFEPPDGAFLAARIDGRAVGCGGICRFDETYASRELSLCFEKTLG